MNFSFLYIWRVSKEYKEGANTHPLWNTIQRQTREIRLQKSQTQCMHKYPCTVRNKISFGTCGTLLRKLYKTKFSQVWEDKYIRYLKRFTLHRLQGSELIIFQVVLSKTITFFRYLIVWSILIEMILYILRKIFMSFDVVYKLYPWKWDIALRSRLVSKLSILPFNTFSR